jgi:hypothetical protein
MFRPNGQCSLLPPLAQRTCVAAASVPSIPGYLKDAQMVTVKTDCAVIGSPPGAQIYCDASAAPSGIIHGATR